MRIDDTTKNLIIRGFIPGLIVLGLIIIISIFLAIKNSYYFSNNNNKMEIDEKTVNSLLNYNDPYSTYNNVSIKNEDDANRLIIEDSVNQIDKCPKNIINLENELISKYKITAINLCEMNYDLAKELENVLDKIYREYPSIRGYLTNLSIENMSMANQGVIAYFKPFNIFASSNTKSGYPEVNKMVVHLNTEYFLNEEKLKIATKISSEEGYFPKNANIYSPLAHELGHYISFVILLKKNNVKSTLLLNDKNSDKIIGTIQDYDAGLASKELLTTAYINYIKDTKDKISFDNWRGTISKYALAKDNQGKYIYDETIAEAFHDCYLNNENAAVASQYITRELKNRLK